MIQILIRDRFSFKPVEHHEAASRGEAAALVRRVLAQWMNPGDRLDWEFHPPGWSHDPKPPTFIYIESAEGEDLDVYAEISEATK